MDYRDEFLKVNGQQPNFQEYLCCHSQSSLKKFHSIIGCKNFFSYDLRQWTLDNTIYSMVEWLTGGLIRKQVLSMTSSRGTPHKKLKQIDRFSHANWVNLSNFNDTTLRFGEKLDHPFSHVFIFGNMFRESHGFISVPVTSSNNFVFFTN